MKLFNIRKAFSLTELLIVLVVVAILFAAMAPIMTKRGKGSTTAQEPVWMFVKNDDYKDAYYDSGLVNKTSTAFVGVNPESLTNNYVPWSKVIVKSIPLQNAIQFRYGEGDGTLSGLLMLDNKGNLFNSSKLLTGTKNKNYNNFFNVDDNKYNTVMGADAFSRAQKSMGATAVGSGAIMGSDNKTPKPSYVTAVGANAGKNISTTKAEEASVFVGSMTGSGTDISSTVAIGSNILSINESAGADNVLIGANVAVGGMINKNAKRNTVIAANSYKSENPVDSTIVGFDTFAGGAETTNAITAAGYSACSSFNTPTSKGSRTCIGYNSGAVLIGSSVSQLLKHNTDDNEHIYLGGPVAPPFGGRSVLEIHNIKDTPYLTALPRVGQTVVLNSNLVVRGNIYFPSVKTGALQAHLTMPLKQGSNVQNRDWCTRGCRLLRRCRKYSYRTKNGCRFLDDLFSWIVNPFGKLFEVITGIGWHDLIGKWGAIFGDFGGFEPSQDWRKIPEEAASNGAWMVPGDLNCNTTSYCPNLKTSDARLKDIISENNEALDKIMYVMPYKYTYMNDANKAPQVGVIAQDLQKYLPNAVSEGKDGYLSIRWDELFYLKLNSINAIYKEIQLITGEVKSLEEATNVLVSDHKDIGNRIDRLNDRLNKLEK